MSTDEARRRSSYHHGDLRAALLEAAVSVVRESGLDAITMRSVAKRAGVSEAAPYHHFENKADLLAHAAILAFGDFAQALDRGVEASRTVGEDRVLGLVEAYVTWGLANPGQYQLIIGRHVVDMGIDTREDAREAGSRTIIAALEIIGASLARRAASTSAEEAFALIRAIGHGVVSLVHEKELGEVSVEQAAAMARRAVGALLDGLG